MRLVSIIILFTALTNNFCTAQYMQVIPGSTGAYNGVHTNDLMVLSQSEAVNLTNPDISGNPFWNEDWKAGVLYTDKYAIFIPKIKLNVFTSDVWYTTADSVIMTAKKGNVKGITFFKGNDTTSILANFVYVKDAKETNYGYYQLLNAGKAQLAKLTTVTVNKGFFDPLTGKTELKYVSQAAYYLYYNAKMTLLKGSNTEAIFAILQPSASAKEWLDKKKSNLKSESDILLFLNFFNSQNGE